MTGPPDDLDIAHTIRDGEQPVLGGRYRVVRELGHGGMGSVYLAEDTQLDDMLVAVKVPSAILAKSPRALRDLKREAKVAMSLSHPAIVTLRGFEAGAEHVYLVVDYIQGKTLDQLLLEAETLTPGTVVSLLRPIAEALDYAHAKKVIHRDLKPSNILIDDAGKAYLADFGIAREMKDTLTLVTGRQDTSGTLPYMSPEQHEGQNPTPAQDIYSFGALLYECLVGHPPFRQGDIGHQIHHKPADPEPLLSLPGLPRVMAESILRCLAKKPQLRPESVRAVFQGQGSEHAGQPAGFETPLLPTRVGKRPGDTAVQPGPAAGAIPIAPQPGSQDGLLFCAGCGTRQTAPSVSFCPNCGRPFGQDAAQPSVPTPKPPPPPVYRQPHANNQRPPTSSGSAFSFTLGLCSLILFCLPVLPFFCGLLAVIIGHTTSASLKKENPKAQNGYATAGIVMGYIGLFLSLLVTSSYLST